MTQPGRPRVIVISSPDTHDVARTVTSGLIDLSLDAEIAGASLADADTDGSEGDRGSAWAVVVLLSPGALADQSWQQRVAGAADQRLVPVLVEKVDDAAVPPFLAELNWVNYQLDNAAFLATLFTGISTDSSRFRDERDTRNLAERWERSGRNEDFLLDDAREVTRRTRAGSVSSDGRPAPVDAGEAAMLAGGFRQRRRAIASILANESGGSPSPAPSLQAYRLALFRGRTDESVARNSSPLVAFLALSRRLSAKRQRQRRRKIAVRAGMAAVTVLAGVFATVEVRQAKIRADNAVDFAVGGGATTDRPDISAIKAGASLLDSDQYSGADGRLRQAIDALSQHWPAGYVRTDEWMVSAVDFAPDGAVIALDGGGNLWSWNLADGTRQTQATELVGVRAGDMDSAGSALGTDGSSVDVWTPESGLQRLLEEPGISAARLSPATGSALVAIEARLVSVPFGQSASSAIELGAWDEVHVIAQTSDGHAVALAERDGRLELVRDDGQSTRFAGTVPTVAGAAIAPDGESFVVVANGVLWRGVDGQTSSTGALVPGVLSALATTNEGLTVLSGRTRGAWAVDSSGLDLGDICKARVLPTMIEIDDLGERVVCVTGSMIVIDELRSLAPAERDQEPPPRTTTVGTAGSLSELSLVDGFILIDRADGTTFAIDSTGASFAEDFVPPEAVSEADFFATGALIGARGVPTTVAVTADGGTFAIGFDDGYLIEVDVRDDSMSRVGSWTLPDRQAITAISWSQDQATISATTQAGNRWERQSCAGCWNADLLTMRISERVWLCYEAGDIASLGRTARDRFSLQACEDRWEAP